MHWLMTAHVRCYLKCYHSSGHVWQGRFKAFPIQDDEHRVTVVRDVERNALRANLVTHAQDWPWSSLGGHGGGPSLEAGPVRRGADWPEFVNAAMTEAEVEAIRTSIRRDRPFGDEPWTRTTAARLGLEYSLQNRGQQPITAQRLA
jgi:putative transposase